jgi:hypothetical protein
MLYSQPEVEAAWGEVLYPKHRQSTTDGLSGR